MTKAIQNLVQNQNYLNFPIDVIGHLYLAAYSDYLGSIKGSDLDKIFT